MEPVDRKKQEKKQLREKKWYKMSQEWKVSSKEPEELKTRIWKGCPNSLRGEVWPLLLQIKRIKESNEQKYGPGIYEVSRIIIALSIFNYLDMSTSF